MAPLEQIEISGAQKKRGAKAAKAALELAQSGGQPDATALVVAATMLVMVVAETRKLPLSIVLGELRNLAIQLEGN